MELRDKFAIDAGTGKEPGEAKVRKNAGRCASDLLATRSSGAVDPVVPSIRGGADANLFTTVQIGDFALLNAAVGHRCGSSGRNDINAYNAGLIEPIDRIAGPNPVAWGRTVDVIEMSVWPGGRSARCITPKRRGEAGAGDGSGAVTSLEDSGPRGTSGGASVLPTAGRENRCRGRETCVSGTYPETVATGMRVAITPSGTSPDSRAVRLDRNTSSPAIRAFAGACSEAVADCAGGDA